MHQEYVMLWVFFGWNSDCTEVRGSICLGDVAFFAGQIDAYAA